MLAVASWSDRQSPDEALAARPLWLFSVGSFGEWPFWSRVFFHAVGGRFGDHRDWLTIDAWADRIAVALPSLRLTSQV